MYDVNYFKQKCSQYANYGRGYSITPTSSTKYCYATNCPSKWELSSSPNQGMYSDLLVTHHRPSPPCSLIIILSYLHRCMVRQNRWSELGFKILLCLLQVSPHSCISHTNFSHYSQSQYSRRYHDTICSGMYSGASNVRRTSSAGTYRCISDCVSNDSEYHWCVWNLS